MLSRTIGRHSGSPSQVCRHWTRHLAGPEIFGDYPNRVGAGTVNDPLNKTSQEVDVVVFGLDDDNRSPLLAIGEAKWNETMGAGHLDRLCRLRALLAGQGRLGAETAKLVCYSGAGFSDQLRAQAAEDDAIVLVPVDTLYQPR